MRLQWLTFRLGPTRHGALAVLCGWLAAASPSEAGDILRGGAANPGSRGRNASAQAAAQAAATTKQNAQDRLTRTTKALQAVNAMQEAARSSARASGNGGGLLPAVPDGLAPNGLEIIGVPTGARSPVQSGSGGDTLVTVEQFEQQALLNWKTFNVGKKTTLQFDQSAGKSDKSKWVAFNRISDPSESPSQILGSIKADGQVYVINQNGIIFGGSSQVNVHTLVASGLPINDNLLSNGLLNNPDLQFLFTTLPQDAGAKGTPAFIPTDPRAGAVRVEAGARLTAPTTEAKAGGRIALIGSNVTNDGTISTPDGQTILAAGLQVAMAAHDSNEASLRGLDVFVGAVGDGGSVVNNGIIDIPRASALLTGRDVKQLGVIDSTTSVSLNGRIDLTANYNVAANSNYDPDIPANGAAYLYQTTGSVTLGPNSVTRIVPEIWSSEKAVGTELALRSRVNIQGQVIHMGRDATLLAPNAQIALQAGAWNYAGTESQFVYTGGQVYLDPGAIIDASGTTDVWAPISQYLLNVQLRGSELASAPLQRDQLLRAVLLSIDARRTGTFNGRFWVGTPLGDATGFLGLIERTVGQLTTAGGSVQIAAGDSVVLSQGSTVDVSGGWINYEGGMVKTTKVLYRGNIIDIAEATPDRIYDGLYTGNFTKTHDKWGVTKTYTNPLAIGSERYEAPYLQGADGGSLSISAPAMALDGTLAGVTVAGPRQVRKTASLSEMPGLSSLNLAFRSQTASGQFTYPSSLRVTFQNEISRGSVAEFALAAPAVPQPLPADRSSAVALSTGLLKGSGFGALSVGNEDGTILVPQGVSVKTAPGGSLSLSAANIDIQGEVISPGGALAFKVYNISPYETALLNAAVNPVVPPPNADRGVFTLGANAVLSAAGLLVDDRSISASPWDERITIAGGSITIETYTARLAEGSVIDVSGGVAISASGKKSYGNGGAITIKTGQDLGLSSVVGGELALGSTLKGYSRKAGGSLTIQAGAIRVGETSSDPQIFAVQPEFFDQGGFSRFALNGLGLKDEAGQTLPAVTIAPNTIIEPVVTSVVGALFGDGKGGVALQTAVLPEESRSPVSISFGAPGVKNPFTNATVIRGDIIMGEGAEIRAGTLGSVALSGNTVAVLGSIFAPGGSISVSGATSSPALFADQMNALATVYIGSRSVLSAAGTTLLTPDAYGRRIGRVLPGGSISISGNIVAAAGAVLDVSGASDVLDLSPTEANVHAAIQISPHSGLTGGLQTLRTVATRVESDGGSITLKGGQMLLSDATLLGRAGGPTAQGGSLTVSSGRFYAEGETPLLVDSNLVVRQSGPTIGSALPDDASAIGQAVLATGSTPSLGRGYFAVDTFTNGGFASLALNGVVQFTGPIKIDAARSLKVANGGVLYADSETRLTAPYVALGMPFPEPVSAEDLQGPFGTGAGTTFPPTFGPGRLIVSASLIDVGTLSLQGIGYAELGADNGDIRGNGILNIAGDLLLRAAQVYPVTASRFSIVAYDHGGTPGSVTVAQSGMRPLPLSAGGQLSIHASIINQAGTLRAPFGAINLGWDGTGTAPVDLLTGNTLPFPVTQQLNLAAGSVTSVSGFDPLTGSGVLVPYGTSTDGNNWIDPYGLDIAASGLPMKTITLSAANISAEADSTIDLRGGGDLYAYRWVEGNGGTVDLLADPSAFAVMPGYEAGFSPLSVFADVETGYTNSGLAVGDRIYMGASSGLAAGVYTLLPARYALLPGAFLVTPKTGVPMGSIAQPDGSSLVSGYRFNDLSSQRAISGVGSRYEVASSAVVRSRAQYDDFFATDFLTASARENGATVSRMPVDAGHLIFQATQSMTLQGAVLAKGGAGGRGGLVDIASASDILIGAGAGSGGAGTLYLDAGLLSSFGAESLLIGGVRTFDGGRTKVTVKTGRITVDNAGSPLSAPDLILASNLALTLAPGASLSASGGLASGDVLYLGSEAVAGSGDGLLIRLSGDPLAQIVRAGVSNSAIPQMNVGAGASFSGESLILDSTYGTSLDPTADLAARFISLNSGQISLVLDNAGAVPPTAGLVLSGDALQDLRAAQALSLLSYSSVDIHGEGEFTTLGSLAIHAAEIRGFNDGGTVSLSASKIILDNAPGKTGPGAVAGLAGILELNADTIHIGANQLAVDQFADVRLNAAAGLFLGGAGGLKAQGDLTASTPFLTIAAQSTQALTAGGDLVISAPVGFTGDPVVSGLGASLSLQGANVTVTSDIQMPSGLLTLHALTGDVTVGGALDVAGVRRNFYDVIKYTDGGQIRLLADLGSVTVGSSGSLNVGADAGGGNAGTLEVRTPTGSFILDGTLAGSGGNGGHGGTFILDTKDLADFGELNESLNDAAFNEARLFRVRNGSVLVDGLVRSHVFNLSVDQGSIVVEGTIDASGVTGGSITLQANGDVTLLDGSLLTVAAEDFSNAGKGGDVTLEAGAQRNGVVGTGAVDIRAGSVIDLSVASKVAGSALSPGTSAWLGQFSGKLHIRAPQNAAHTDLLVNPINGTIVDASSILVEGYRLYDLTGSGGAITTAVQSAINADAAAFLGAAGSTTANYTAMMDRLLANNADLASVLVLAPGAEIINRTGDLTLGTTSSQASSDWNLGTFRYGAKSAAGVLTMRAAGNLVLYNALSDGFATSAYNSQLLAYNPLLPVNNQSWSYRLSGGADLSAVDFGEVLSASSLGANAGFIKLGKDNGENVSNSNGSSNPSGNNALTSLALTNRYQVIRTGSGDIDISAGRSIQLLNHFATIYTAGTRVADYTMGGTFDVPVLNQTGGNVTLGAIQQTPTYAVQYTMAGGNVSLKAGQNIEHLTMSGGVLVADSQNQLPNNWLYRRGYVDAATGVFGRARNATTGDIASTTWWVDFSNFFQGIGALGGGDVTLIAGQDISNVDAVIPTNARMTGKDAAGNAVSPNADNLLELGGGDLVVQAGRNIDAGVYYVERGEGNLAAGKDIVTNATRSPNMISSPADVGDSHTWLPTTLFLGKGGFDVTARGNVLLGPVANAFLLPEGVNNTFWYKTYFSTYASDSYVDVSSLSGEVTLRESATLAASGAGFATPLLQAWLQNVQLLTTNPNSTSYYRPWLRLNETSVEEFSTVVTLLPGTLRVTAFSDDINLAGNITLAPSPTGTLELLTAGSINGLQPNGEVFLPGGNATSWSPSIINISDANPAGIPGIASPFAYQTLVGTITAQARNSRQGFLKFISALFSETGSTVGNIQTKQSLHTPGLHQGDDSPIRLYAGEGDISGLTLFAPKVSRIFAGRDIADIALYIQNTGADDFSVVASGRDIIPYQANTALRVAANEAGNTPNGGAGPLAGDIQISGPGVLEVLAGRNLDLGTGVSNLDGTGTGITSIGNSRNPYLNFAGAELIVGAGIGLVPGLSSGEFDYEAFLQEYGASYPEADGGDTSSPEAQSRLALQVLFQVLRDAGRNYSTTGLTAYERGYEAIDFLFGSVAGRGDILTRSRDIRTKNGGDITIFAPAGKLTLANATIGNPQIPPGIVTESGGNISILTRDSVDIGIGRIFTLRGGNEIIWSSLGDIAAGSSAKTVKSAPPTRVLIDPQSADVQTDLAGLATGGGIGVLATVAGVAPGDVDLIAPVGTVDAGDAGIRVSGNLNIAATQVLNAGNIAVAGSTSGVPTAPTVAAPNISGLTSSSNAAAAVNSAANEVAGQARTQPEQEEVNSIITVEVLGYGGDEEDEESRRNQADG